MGIQLQIMVWALVLALVQCGPFLDYCNTIPYNFITQCNTTCATCLSRNQCSTCPSYLTLDSGNCISPSSQKIRYSQYFNSVNLYYSNDLLQFQSPMGVLSSDEVFLFCIESKYKFDIIGLFTNNDQLKFSQTYPLEVSEIALNFRLFSSSSFAILKIYINQKLMYSKTMNSGFNLNFSSTGQNPERDSAGNLYNIFRIDGDPIAYVDQVFRPIQTGLISLSATYAHIRITVADGTLNASSGIFWGISELSVVSIQCGNCISQQLLTLATRLGIAIGIAAGSILLLLFFLRIYYHVKLVKNRQRMRRRFYENEDKKSRYESKNRSLVQLHR